jgi:hypothetical protein
MISVRANERLFMRKFATALALAFAASAGAAAAQTLAAHTSTVLFTAKSMHVTAHATGYCWTGSIASTRNDAYRCMAGNNIHDPCFPLNAHSVACPVDAGQNTGVEIALTKPLPAHPRAAANAWQMRLVSGALCNLGTGTTIPDYPYYCTGNLVCSAPPPGESRTAVFVHCATETEGKITPQGSYLVTTLYE